MKPSYIKEDRYFTSTTVVDCYFASKFFIWTAYNASYKIMFGFLGGGNDQIKDIKYKLSFARSMCGSIAKRCNVLEERNKS